MGEAPTEPGRLKDYYDGVLELNGELEFYGKGAGGGEEILSIDDEAQDDDDDVGSLFPVTTVLVDSDGLSRTAYLC